MTGAVASGHPHGAHLTVLFAVLAGLALVATAADLLNRRGRRITGGALSAALLSASAGAVHAAVAPAHLREGIPVGAFFVVVATAQVTWSLLTLSTGRRAVRLLGLALNAGVLAVWALSRTVGLPVGAEAGQVESIGLADLLASSAELALVVVLARSLNPRRSARRRAAPPPRRSPGRARAAHGGSPAPASR